MYSSGRAVFSHKHPQHDMQKHIVKHYACVCVCVKAPRNTVLMVFNQFQISKQGAGEGGGGSPANEDPPPHPVQTYLHFRFSVE